MQRRLVDAMDVLRRLPDREAGWLRTSTMSLWRQVQADWTETAAADRPLVTCALTRNEVGLADEALGWVAAYVPTGVTRQIVGLALMQLARTGSDRVEWSPIWERMGGHDGGWTTDGLRMRYGRALNGICKKVNRGKSGG
ncbi:hypothetical protein FYJ91_16360 [Sphingomonas montanisoli]|uniref:Uncharacterized protein n=1 Tax=Sphingomonas montanisoli TaxID=2606412 RepID=A0A5D9C420_9SPHN|nr:hypothetical protein FYJ91_16360 [Sphingomonas montanisoli]